MTRREGIFAISVDGTIYLHEKKGGGDCKIDQLGTVRRQTILRREWIRVESVLIILEDGGQLQGSVKTSRNLFTEIAMCDD